MDMYNRQVRILLLNLYFPPDTSATARVAASLAGALAERHEVTVMCGRPSYDPTERRAWKLWQTERVKLAAGGPTRCIKVIRVGSTDYPRIQMKRRVLNYLSYAALALAGALFSRCDAIVAMTDPPFAGILGALVAMLKHTPYVYNIQDMYPDMALGGLIMRPGILSRLWEKLHRWALRRATKIVVLGEDMRARIVTKHIDPARVTIVRAGGELTSPGSLQPPLDADIRRAIRGDFRFVLLHAGNLGFYGAWDTLIGAARELESAGVGLVFVGDGAERTRLQTAAADCGNVRFLPFFPADKIPSVLGAPDIHVITVKRGLEGVVVPSKMYGILGAGKPILAVASSKTDVAMLGARHGFAISADPDKPEEVVAAVRRACADTSRLDSMARAARTTASEYESGAELQKFVRIFDSLAARVIVGN
ncbi:MAG: glycosyltransferase family 4 protein [Candidatus Acidiferrum sp.]